MKHYQIMLILFIAGGSVFLIARLWQKIIDKRKGSNPYSWANLLCLYAGVVALLGGLPLLHMLIINLLSPKTLTMVREIHRMTNLLSRFFSPGHGNFRGIRSAAEAVVRKVKRTRNL